VGRRHGGIVLVLLLLLVLIRGNRGRCVWWEVRVLRVVG
jgi:hypothetical protein